MLEELRQEFLALESIPIPSRLDQRVGPGTMIPTRRAFILARMDEPLARGHEQSQTMERETFPRAEP